MFYSESETALLTALQERYEPMNKRYSLDRVQDVSGNYISFEYNGTGEHQITIPAFNSVEQQQAVSFDFPNYESLQILVQYANFPFDQEESLLDSVTVEISTAGKTREQINTEIFNALDSILNAINEFEDGLKVI